MADLVVGAVVILGIALLEPLHEFAERWTGALEQQMDVIGHLSLYRSAKFTGMVG